MSCRLAITLALAALVIGLLGVSPAASANGLPAGGTFLDDDGNTHEGNIEAIAARLITQGCILNTFYCPGDDVTRAQMASFLARAFDLPATAIDFFDDDDGNTHEAAINRIAAAGITLGFPDGTYRPSGNVNREQMASFLARAMGVDPVGGNRFADVSGTHEGNINAIAEAGVTLGCDPDGTVYCPLDNVRRDQMASFLARATGLVPVPVVARPTQPEGEQLNVFTSPEALNWTADTAFYIRHGWSISELDELPAVTSGARRFELFIDGKPLEMVGPIYESPRGAEFAPIDPNDWDPAATGNLSVTYMFVFPGGLSGEHTIQGNWFFDNVLDLEKIISAVFS